MGASVQILLASYNGETYIGSQLESILVQDYKDFEVLVSDDGSQDNTVAVVGGYANADSRVRLVSDGASYGGARNNFLSLVAQATAPYIAFCDQDDVWLSDKLAIELDEMHRLEEVYGSDAPLLVFSDLVVVDEALDVVSPSFMRYSGIDPQRVSLANLLAQNVSPGCVMLANRALYYDTLRLPESREGVIMHDWWFMLTASAFGYLGFVDEATMLYRQHEDNAVGAQANTASGIVGRLGTFAHKFVPAAAQLDSVDVRLAQAQAFADAYADELTLHDRQLCEEFARLLSLAPAERIRWCHEHDVQNATPVMRLGMDWELLLYERGRKASPQDVAPASKNVDQGDAEPKPTDDVPVAVVMSTYNGERYLAEQIESVLAQDAPGVRLFVRDDGSTDGTVALLQSYAKSGLIDFVAGENKGVVESFYEALALPPRDYPYVAFCDQDDVWHHDKISRALAVLAPRDQSIPQLYCSEYVFCDEQLETKAPSHLSRIGVSFSTLMVETICSGNTTVMNRVLVDELLAHGTKGVYLHDWWSALVAAGLGEVSFDDFASLDYRRISSSVSPTGSSGLSLLMYRVRTFLGGGQLKRITQQLEEYRACYKDRLRREDRELLDLLLDGGGLRKAFVPSRLRQKPTEELAVRMLFLLGLL